MKDPDLQYVGAKVPSKLLAAFDEAVHTLGIAKQRVVAAAMHKFLELSEDDQTKATQDAWKKYGRKP